MKRQSFTHPNGWFAIQIEDDGSYRFTLDDNGHELFRFYSADDIVTEAEENRDFAAVVAAFSHILTFSRWGMEEEAREIPPDDDTDYEGLSF